MANQKKYLDYTGLADFLSKLKQIFATKDEITGSPDFKLKKNADNSVTLEWYKPD